MKESAIVRQILDYLKAENIFAFRLNTAAFAVEKRFFRSHSLGAGAADILAIASAQISHQGIAFLLHSPLWIECKNENGKQSSEQISFQQYVEGLGHRYILARSFEDVATKIRSVK